MSRLSVILTILLCTIVAQFTVAAEIGTHNYDIYVGDINNDGDSDFYFHGKPLTLILHGDIATPIMLTAPVSFVIYRNYDDYNTPVAYSLSFIQVAAKVAAGELKLYKNNDDFFIWANNSSGQNNVLLRGNDAYSPALLLSSFSNISFPLLSQIYPASGYANISDRSIPLSLQDINHDGRKDIVVGTSSGDNGEYAFVADANGLPSATYLELTPSIERPPVAATHVGSTAGEFRVDESGAATYNIPIAFAEGVAGVTPQLSLGYSSQGGSGLAGQGWSLGGLSAITRCRQTLSQDNAAKPITWGAEDRFCLNGQKLMLVTGTYGSAESEYRTEIDSGILVTAKGGTSGNPGYFIAAAKDGSLTTYGNTADSKILASATFVWSINRFEDNVKNRINYVYDLDSEKRQQLLTRINYAYTQPNSDAAVAGAYVSLEYVDRRDLITSYVTGYGFKQTKKLKTIKVFNNNQNIRTYDLAYHPLQSTVKTERLASIQECVGASCFSATQFSYTPDRTIQVETTGGTIDVENLVNYVLFDVNGDGVQDIAWLSLHSAPDSTWPYKHVLEYALGTDLGFSKQNFKKEISVKTATALTQMKVIDYNADGRSDLMLKAANSWLVLIAQPQTDGTWALFSGPAIPFTDSNVGFADLTSNGLPEAYMLGASKGLNVYKLVAREGVISRLRYEYVLDKEYPLPTANIPVGSSPGANWVKESDWKIDYIEEKKLADLNGDGRADIVALASMTWKNYNVYPPQNQSVTKSVSYLAKGTPENTYYEFYDFIDGDFSDLNGDGLSDLVSPKSFRLNNGSGFSEAKVLIEAASRQFVDVNGDGMLDVVWVDTLNKSLKYGLWDSNSENFVFYLNYLLTSNGTVANNGYSAGDVNGDGSVDVIQTAVVSGTSKTRITRRLASIDSKGGLLSDITSGMGNVTSIKHKRLDKKNPHYTSVWGVNSTAQTNEFCYANTYVAGLQHCHSAITYTTDVAKFYAQIDNPMYYLGDAAPTPDPLKPILEVVGPLYVVTSVASSAPRAGAGPGQVDVNAKSEVSYFYHHLRAQAAGRGMLGFEKLTTIDSQTGIKTETTYRQDWPYIGSPLKTVTKTSDDKILSEAENTWSMHTFGGVGAKYFQPYIAKSTEKSYALQASGVEQGELLQSVITENEYDHYGNPTRIAVTTSGKTPEGTETQLKSQTINTYGSPGVDNYHNRMGRLTVTAVITTRDAEPSKVRTSTFSYYGDNDPNGAKGLLWTTVVEPNDPMNVKTEYRYDNFGNKAKVLVSGKGSSGQLETRSTTSVYENGRYLKSTTNDLSQQTTVGSRNEYGAITSASDINNINSKIYYDAMGSEYMRKDDSGAWTRTETQFCTTNSGCPSGGKFFTTNRVAGGGRATEYFDILGRVIRSSKIAFDGQVINVDTEYDNLSRVKRQSNPYYASSGAAIDWTTNEYDILGRLEKTTSPDGSIGTTAYDGYENIVKNNLLQTRTERRNGLGQLVKVTDHLGGTIDYIYDIQGGLLSAKTDAPDANPVEVRMCYDRFGRKIAMHDPNKGGFAGTDADRSATCASIAPNGVLSSTRKAGWWYYSYNAFGELISQTDPKGQTSSLNYDALGRMKSRTDKHANGSLEGYTEWFYDADEDGSGAKGKLTSVVMNTTAATASCTNGQSNCYRSLHNFDQYGRATNTKVYYPGSATAYVTSAAYDRFSRPSLQYDALHNVIVANGSPQPSGTETLYNQYGYAEKTLDLASGKLLTQIQKTNVFGSVTEELRGNGLISRNSYDSKTGQLRNQQTGHALNVYNIQDNEYAWDTIGNLKFRKNLSGKINTPVAANSTTGKKNLAESFCYDGLNRLIKTVAGASENPVCTGVQDVQYNGLGNITFKAQVGTYAYGNYAGPHAVTSTTLNGAVTATYTYDNNGNQISGDGRAITYSTYDQPTRITKGGAVVDFSYGPDRSRWQRVDTKSGVITTTTYLGNIERIQRGASLEWKRNVGGVLRTYKTDTSNALQLSDKRYIYNDHLGSLDLLTDAAGEVPPAFSKVSHSMSFDAWGARRSGETWGAFAITQLNLTGFVQPITTRGFTGHEMLDDMGLIHMNGRIYDPKLARFLQADPFIQAATNTQSYNRYSYLWNNPLNATDPSGFFLKKLWNEIRPFVGAIVGIVLAIVAPWSGPWAAAAYGAIAGGVGAAANGGNILRGALTGAVSAAAFYGVGSAFQGLENAGGNFFDSGLTAGAFVAKVAAHGMVGGVMSSLQGGKFGHGFAAAGVTQAFSGKIDSIGSSKGSSGWSSAGSRAARITAAAVVGGTASSISGGKFANGAITGAFSRAFNDEAPEHMRRGHAGRNARWFEEKMQRMLKTGNAGEGHELTYKEAKWWWRNADGKTLIVDGRELSVIDVGGEFTAPFPLDDLKVHGHVTTNPSNGRIYDGMYDFEPRVMPNPNGQMKITIRNMLNETAIKQHGPGTPFKIQYRYEDSDFD